MAQTIPVTINSKVSAGSATSSPTVSLVTSSTTQVPTHVEHVVSFTQGEQPQCLVHMKDNTWAYIAQNLLTQSGGKVVI